MSNKSSVIVVILILLAYVTCGVIYHNQATKCYEVRHSLDKDQPHSGDTGLIGWTFDVISWPLYLYGDAVNRLGIFDCKPHANDDIYSLIKARVDDGYQVKYTNDIKVENIPSDIYSVQIGGKLILDNVILALVMQPNVNYNIPFGKPNMPIEDIKWAGILVSLDEGRTWQKYFTINNPKNEKAHNAAGVIVFNPVDIFTADKKLFIDIVDDIGTGSGEGNLVRFQSSDGGITWQKARCYYFVPEDYYLPDDTSRQSINSNKLKTSNECVY